MKNAPLNLSKTPSIDDYFAAPDVHVVHREGQGGFLTFFVLLLLFAVECLLIYWVITGRMALATGLILHGAVVAILFIYARALVGRGTENRYAILAALSVATCGPFGAAGVMLTVLLHHWFGRRAHHFAHWFDTIFPPAVQTRAQRIYDNMMIGRDEAAASYSVISFLDVLSFGSETQKRQALAKMTSNFHPNFATAFRKALSDASNTIRVQAATAITKIENHFTHRLVALAMLKAGHPKDPVVVLALAEHYDNYAYTGLLDSDRERSNRQHALEGYQDYLKLKPNDLDVRTRVGRLLMREKEYDKAYHWFRQCMDMGYTSETMNQWYAEALFSTGRYDELRRFSHGYKPLTADQFTPPPPAIAEAMALWQSGGRA